MGKIYGGVNGAAAEIKKIYGGVGSAACEISKVYAGVNGAAQLIWEKTSRQRVSLPDMTSRSAPSGYCAASSTGSSAGQSYYAFDGSDTNYWESQVVSVDADRWVKYDFGFGVYPETIRLINGYSNTSRPASRFCIEASVDDSTWVVLVDGTDNTAAVDTTYPITAPYTNTAYRYYRYRAVKVNNTYRARVYKMKVYGYIDS